MVAARHVVGHEVDDHLHPLVVDAGHESLELLHAVLYVGGQIGIDVVVVLYGVGRSGLAFDHVWIVAAYAVTVPVGLLGVLYHAREPDVRHSKLLYAFDDVVVYIVEFSGAVAGIRAVGHTVMGGVGEKPRQQLINDRFLVVHCLSVVDNSVAAVPGRLKPLASRKFMVSR